jgi:hypothetical protein
MLVAECLTALLFPFEWTLLYVPIVFTAALVCLDVPVPAIMGLRTRKSSTSADAAHRHGADEHDSSSDTSDDANFEVQRCVVQVDTGRIQLPDDMPRFPDRARFIDELNEILSRFDCCVQQDVSKGNGATCSKRVRQSDDWTELDESDATNEQRERPSQALARLAAIAKRTGIVTSDQCDEEIKYGASLVRVSTSLLVST